MAFDKTTAMRNAERHLSQGKIASAIAEYKQVVQNDPKDFVTLNMLGDLCVKENDTRQALRCYMAVAEYYSKQGFAAKAIAVYNKVARITPDNPEVTEQLAELHKQKGSIGEAKAHYTSLANFYERTNKKLESLSIWKKVADLDANNTSVLAKIGDAYLHEGENDEAVEAFVRLGERLNLQNKFGDAASAFQRALAIDERNRPALIGFCESKQALGSASEATEMLESLLSSDSTDREAAKLLFDCHIKQSDPAEAERVLVKLVELEPSNTKLFLKLGHCFLENSDVTGAARSISLSADPLLVAGMGQEVFELASAVIEIEPQQVEALRAICDFYTWQRDEPSLLVALRRLAIAARDAESVHEERFALSQLALVVPQETEHAERLRAVNQLHGFEVDEVSSNGFEDLFADRIASNDGPAADADPVSPQAVDANFGNFEFSSGEVPASAYVETAYEGDIPPAESAEIFERPETIAAEVHKNGKADADPESRLLKEIESIRFYVDNGYAELAQKAADELRSEFGERPEIADLFAYVSGTASSEEPRSDQASKPEFAPTSGEVVDMSISGSFDLNDLRSELGLEDDCENHDTDYDTHYHTAIAYQEMGLLEEAINEFQNAVNLVNVNDGTRRFFQCANLLGHCFMLMGKPNLALMWYQRTLETPGLNDDEKQGLWYELASAYEADGDQSNAARFFERVYAENINYRDVGDRLRSIAVPA